MGDALGQFLPYAIAVAISPGAIAALLLMLVTRNAKTNGPLYVLGWITGLTVVGAVVLLIPGVEPSQGEPSVWTGVVKGVLGVLLFFGAVRSWRNRPMEGEEAEAPGWMSRIEELGGGASFGIGVLVTAGNPKNLLLTVGGAVTIAAADLSSGQSWLSLGLFVVIASLGVLVPVIAYLTLGQKAAAAMTKTRDRLNQNNAIVMTVLLLIVGVAFAGDAIEILL